MNLHGIGKIKGFMPPHEGKALIKWASEFSIKGMIMEIGTYCGKSSMYLSRGARSCPSKVPTKKDDVFLLTYGWVAGPATRRDPPARTTTMTTRTTFFFYL